MRDFPRPHNVKIVRSLLRISNYYRRFIKDFAKIAAPLNRLLRKDQKFLWTDAFEQAFKALKDALISAPILAFPNFSETFHLYTDASNEGIGATLDQFHDGKDVTMQGEILMMQNVITALLREKHLQLFLASRNLHPIFMVANLFCIPIIIRLNGLWQLQTLLEDWLNGLY